MMRTKKLGQHRPSRRRRAGVFIVHAKHRAPAKWRMSFLFIALILLVSGGAFLLFSKNDPPSPGPAPLALQTPPLARTVRVYMQDEGRILSMDFEEYLVGVVAAEMPASYETEALKAQAVAARSYALYNIEHGGCSHDGADVCSDYACCQAYVGEARRKLNWGDNFSLYEQKIRQAVIETTDQVLLYDGTVAQTFFHAVAGGMTEDVQAVWGSARPYLVPVESTGEEEARRYNGSVTVTRDAFFAALSRIRQGVRQGTLQDCIGKISRTESGRVDTIEIGGVLFTGNQLRSAFSLNSTNFKITIRGDEAIFETIGYGHGVGMSQAGANAMAKNGSGYLQILYHYYTGVEIATIQSMN